MGSEVTRQARQRPYARSSSEMSSESIDALNFKNKMTNYSSTVQDLSSNLTLDKLKQAIEPFRDTKFLIGITARPEIKNYLLENIPTKTMDKNDVYFNSPDSLYGVKFYVVNSQKEPIKYWYNDQEKELREYLINNILYNR